jgi:hypothetical protein
MLHPAFTEQRLHEQKRDLERRVRNAHLGRSSEAPIEAPAEPLTLRLSGASDCEGLARLAALEGRPVPQGSQIVAEIAGVIVAALPLGGGPALADPFRRTLQLLPLLELRAEQFSPARPRRVPALWCAVRRWRWSRV